MTYQIVIQLKPGMGPIDQEEMECHPHDPENAVRMTLDDDHYNSDKAMSMASAQFMSIYPQVEWAEVRNLRLNDPPMRYRDGSRSAE